MEKRDMGDYLLEPLDGHSLEQLKRVAIRLRQAQSFPLITLKVVEWRGHEYLVRTNGGILHAESCPGHHAKAEEE